MPNKNMKFFLLQIPLLGDPRRGPDKWFKQALPLNQIKKYDKKHPELIKKKGTVSRTNLIPNNCLNSLVKWKLEWNVDKPDDLKRNPL